MAQARKKKSEIINEIADQMAEELGVEKELQEEASTPREKVVLVSSQQAGIVRSMISPAEARDNWQAYQELCNAILDPSDFTKIVSFVRGKGSVTKLFKNKSAWRKLATAFNLSSEIVKEERDDRGDHFVIRIIARITAPNGRFVDGTGTCASDERNFAHLEHDVRAQAETRAKNRAISDMIGGGEVTAEEMMQMEERKKSACPRDHSKLPQKQVTTPGKNLGRGYVRCPSCVFFEWTDEIDAKDTTVDG